VVATLVDGAVGTGNCNNNEEDVYLPTSDGYCPCYYCYLKSLGYSAKPNASEVVTVTWDGPDNMADAPNYVSLSTYVTIWRHHYRHLKVSCPAGDIYEMCYRFANRHRHFAVHNRDTSMATNSADDGNLFQLMDDLNINVSNEEDDDTSIDEDGMHGTKSNDIKQDVDEGETTNTMDKEWELMLLRAVVHVRAARAQSILYQECMKCAVSDTKQNVCHDSKTYTLVVDYCQNMEVPEFNKEQPGCAYYFSPVGVYTCGVVNHGHLNNDGTVREHMHAHVYHEGTGKKGSNNVASHIMKTLRFMDIIRDNEAGGELNIFFDNCSGQNKNNTALKLLVWLCEMGYFKRVNFNFLIVGHTKNAADHLFNVLKLQYHKEHISQWRIYYLF